MNLRGMSLRNTPACRQSRFGGGDAWRMQPQREYAEARPAGSASRWSRRGVVRRLSAPAAGQRAIMLYAACCMLHVVCCMLHVVCCVLHVVRCICMAHAACCRQVALLQTDNGHPAGAERHGAAVRACSASTRPPTYVSKSMMWPLYALSGSSAYLFPDDNRSGSLHTSTLRGSLPTT